ncbi:hypothetical protein V1514DRAFT_337627 [Lipomyces japonicus]|uniref:uncharacterized protein n=1 Tax=Lipomyces japonicus TaxID=56871 RepID=UPI0034CD15C2
MSNHKPAFPIPIRAFPNSNNNNIIRTPYLTPDPDTALRLPIDATPASPSSNTGYLNSYFHSRTQSPLASNLHLPRPHTKAPDVFTIANSQQILPSEHAWDKTIERIVKGIVSIKAAAVRAFDTEGAGDYTATGFVVDKKNGIILSNRHVVNPAPITATAVFVNYEEVPLLPIYKDPVHDFGFFKYDPAKVKFLDVEQIDLRPDLAKVGLSIKVVGNDSGEKLSILGSTLARLDRSAPHYGDDTYEDFNTFYFQAATGTSGGSSGSPVLNIAGQAIALNAGGSKRSASSFYLPLDRVVRALKCIQLGLPVSRGSFQTEFIHKSYDELRRLGLTPEAEGACRERNLFSTGLLTVSKVLPEGPAFGKLEPGDMLLSCNGQIIEGFVQLFEILDEKVGDDVQLTLFRGKKLFTETVQVEDLHAITPSRFAEVGGGVFHDLSYHQARSNGMPVRNQGVYVALSGMLNWSSLTRNFLVTSLNNKPTPNLEEFLIVLKTIPDGKRVPIRQRDLGQIREKSGLVHIDRHFHLDHLFFRNDKTGIWDRTTLFPNANELKLKSNDVDTNILDTVDFDDKEERENLSSLDNLKQSLIHVTSRLPFSIYGYTSSRPYYGVGTLVSLENNFPIVACDRAAAPSEFIDIKLTIQHYAVSARVIALDKVAFLTFDMNELPAHVKLVVPDFDADYDIKVKDEVTIVGLNSSYEFIEKVTSISSLADVGTTKCNPPRFRFVNVEGISVQDSAACDGGVISRKDENGNYNVVALWINASSQNSSGNDTFWKTGLHFGAYVKPGLDSIMSKSSPLKRTFNIECSEVSLSTATGHGLSPQRLQQFVKLGKKYLNTHTVKLLNVYDKFPHPNQLTNELEHGDIILEIDHVPVIRLMEIERCLRDESRSEFVFTILRHGQEKQLTINAVKHISTEASQIVQWSGAFLHETQPEAIEQVAHNTNLVPLSGGIYVGSVSFGAPALNSIRPAQWIIEIDDMPVSSISQFLDVVRNKRWQDGEFVRVKQVSRKDVTSVVSVQINERFWPTRILEITNDERKWLHSVV